MTVLIAWVSLSVGIVMGAAWRSLCEKQSRRHTSLADGSMMLHQLNLEPRSWHRQLDRAEARKQQSA
jgi:hypothetical protein